MCTYLKNMEGKKPKDLKNKSFNSIPNMFDKSFKRLNTFVDFITDLVEEIAELDDDQEADKIKELMEIVPDKEEVAIYAIPLAVKPPSITASTPIETQKPLLKDENGEEVDVHMYRSMIGSIMYLTSSRPDIMFAVCAYARYQVNLKVSHLHDVKRIFRYLKGQPKLDLWYLKDSPFDLVVYTDSDYAGASLDRKSTTGGCQFLRCRLISWQCKKQTVFANSTTEAEYVAALSCCGQVLWI
ncbi:hypothetical protein Tco_0070242 [Tanacetum coccineum]